MTDIPARTNGERDAWLEGWERGLDFGFVRGRNAYRVKLRKMHREKGARAVIEHLLARSHTKARKSR